MATYASNVTFRRQVPAALAYFVAAYLTVSILATAFVFGVIWVLDLPTAAQLGVSRMHDPGFLISEPYILGINLLCWPTFAALYYRKRTVSTRVATSIALLWLVSAMLLDLVFFVVIKTPISLTAHEFYIENQPWITLAYVSILAGHVIDHLLRRFRKQRQRA